MSIISTIKGWLTMLFTSKAKEEFGIEPISSDQVDAWVRECINILVGARLPPEFV